MKRIVGLILMLACLSSVQVQADDSDVRSVYAHFGMGALMTTACYGVTKQMFRLEKDERWKARFLCVFASSAVVLGREFMVHGPVDGSDIRNGLTGVAASTVMTWAFDF